MPRFFTHYWTTATCDDMYENDWEGYPLDYTAGEGFAEAGVAAGDLVYVVSVTKGQLFLIGRMKVAEIVYSPDEAEDLLGEDVWEAEEHLIGDEAAGTPMSFTRIVEVDTLMELRVLGGDGLKPLKILPNGRLDRQMLRDVREIDEHSAKLLDNLLSTTDGGDHPSRGADITDEELDAIAVRFADAARNRRMQELATSAATELLVAEGWKFVRAVDDPRAGYDLLFQFDGNEKHVSVKATSDLDLSFTLSEQEFARSERDEHWVLILATDALNVPRLHRLKGIGVMDRFDVRPLSYAIRLRGDEQ